MTGGNTPPHGLDSDKRRRQEILRRDGWRCQKCGTMFKLEVHHQVFRSQGGSHSEENLITVCAACHAAVHRH
jgi:5-methylcytosine-specific restriction endonuclease McrA